MWWRKFFPVSPQHFISTIFDYFLFGFIVLHHHQLFVYLHTSVSLVSVPIISISNCNCISKQLLSMYVCVCVYVCRYFSFFANVFLNLHCYTTFTYYWHANYTQYLECWYGFLCSIVEETVFERSNNYL